MRSLAKVTPCIMLMAYSDQVIRLTNYSTKQKYPAVLRRITYYAADKNKTFVYLTNNMEITATEVAFLYKYR